MKQIKHLFIILSLLVVVLAGCTSEQDAASTTKADADVKKEETKSSETNETSATETASNVEIPEAVQKPIKIAAIMQMSIGTFSSQYIAGVKEQVEKFGGEVQIYNADNDLSKMAIIC